MKSDSLTRQAIRLAQREGRKRGYALSREEVLRLSVQTVEPWMRALFVAVGLAACGLAWVCLFAGAPWWIWVSFGLGGMGVGIVGLVGKKAYLERELQKLGRDGPTRIADAILNALL